MNPIYRWLVWVIATAVVVATGFKHNWDNTHKVLLAIIIVLGIFNFVAPSLQSQLLQKLKAMPPEEREKFLARFDQKTQEKLRKQLETP